MSLVEAQRSADSLRLTITRAGKRNALSFAVIRELGAALAAHRDDPELKFLVLTGAGDQAFCAGADLKDMDAVRTREATRAMADEYRGVLDALRGFPVPVVAALNGAALGGGAELALACDLRVAAATARIGFLQGSMGITTAWGGGADLLDTVGRSRALWLLASAAIVDAPSALQLGLVNAIAAAGESLDDCVQRFCVPFQLRTARVMRGFKALAVARAAGTDRAGLAAIETGHLIDTWTHEDHWRAVAESQGRAGKR
jgi:enoyl-CoA hydratase